MWTDELDCSLIAAVKRCDGNWKRVGEEMRIPHTECKKRYIDEVDPSLRVPWSVVEDTRLCDMVEKQGRNWDILAKNHALGRSGKQLQSRYNMLMQNVSFDLDIDSIVMFDDHINMPMNVSGASTKAPATNVLQNQHAFSIQTVLVPLRADGVTKRLAVTLGGLNQRSLSFSFTTRF